MMSRPHFLLVVLSVITALSFSSGKVFGEQGSPLLKASPLQPAEQREDERLFEKLLPEKTGVDHVNLIDPKHPLTRVYHASSACGGVAIGDLDLDGKTDLFLANGPRKNSLYLQKGDLQFENVASEFGMEGTEETWATGVVMADINNDGDLDIYLCHYDLPNRLFVNQLKETGKLGFVERAEELGVAVDDGSVIPAFADFDRDGDLDLYLLTNQIYRENGRPAETIPFVGKGDDLKVAKPWDRWYMIDPQRGENGEVVYVECGRPDYFFRNDGDAGFVEITEEAGITKDGRWGNSATWWDYNYDGWPDLFLAHDFVDPDHLYRNNGDGTFTEVAEGILRHSTWFSMGSVQADLNNDGFIDLFVADMLPRSHYFKKATMGTMGVGYDVLDELPGPYQLMRNVLHINTGTDRFLEGAWMAGLASTDWTWGMKCEDFDCDGWTDFFFTNGTPRIFDHSDLPAQTHESRVGRTHWDHYKHMPERREQNLAYRNRGEFKFEEATRPWGLDHIGMSYAASKGDLDGDGWLDLVVSNLQDPTSLFRHRGNENKRIIVELRGTQSNTFGIGSLVTVETAAGRQSKQLFNTGGFMNSDQPLAHFGVGTETDIPVLRIDWPSGVTQVFRDLKAEQRFVITEPEEKAEKAPPVKSRRQTDTMFTESKALAGFGKTEKDFDDFARQSLLPFQLSQLGPSQAWGDVDGDGDPDLFLGGPSGESGQLFRNQTKPGAERVMLTPVTVFAFAKDAAHEDMGAVFFDFDADGDQDLYVASGSIECEPGAEVLQDRLYLNDGQGDFSKAPKGTLPSIRESSSVVAGADYDRDGDVDLFVGSRSIPGQYPAFPRSALLKLEEGRFLEATESVAPGLPKTGLVTSALWSDVNSDGWVDLLVAHDWGAVKLFRNVEGTLKDDTEEAGLNRYLGWWNGISGADIDNDGDIDFVATNLGLSTQYHASLEKPELIFFGDFDGTGKYHIVEAEFEMEEGTKVCYPRRGLSCSSRAMPFIVDKMRTYHNYASAALTEIYDANRLQRSLMHKANELNSVYFLNDGEGHFEGKPLPRMAQISPGFGVALHDVDLDGWTDCYVVQNHFTPQIETGPMSGGLSVLMKGTGQKEAPFETVWPQLSGLEVPGDAKSLGAVDLNLDGKIDYLAGVNDGDPMIFLNRTQSTTHHSLRIRLAGSAENPTGIGARVAIGIPGGATRVAEVYSGGGYLTDLEKDLFFAIPDKVKGDLTIEVQWPDGLSSTMTTDASTEALQLRREKK